MHQKSKQGYHKSENGQGKTSSRSEEIKVREWKFFEKKSGLIEIITLLMKGWKKYFGSL